MNALSDNTFLSWDHKIGSNASSSFRRQRKSLQVGAACLAASVSIAALMTATRAQADMAGNLTIIGTLGGNSSEGFGVSNDGSVVVGRSTVSPEPKNQRAFRWTSAGGIVNLLGALPNVSEANGVSADGSTVVGSYFIAGGATAFSFTNGVKTDLTLAGKPFSQATAVSANGQVVVGFTYIAGNAETATRWVNGFGTDLGVLAGGNRSYAYGVSADGSVVTGYSDSVAGTRAFRWEGGVMTALPTLGGNSSYGYGVSGDGTVIVGEARLAGNNVSHAFRWSAATGMVDIEATPGAGSSGYAVNTNGSVIVGITNQSAFRWTQATGMMKLDALLSGAGVNMTGRTLRSALGISGNGEFIVGTANIDGVGPRAYLARYYETTTGIIAGVTDATSVQTSVDGTGDSRNQIDTQQQGFTAQLLQEDIPFFKSDYVGVFGSVGSASGGVTARYDTGPFTLKFGAGMAAEDYKGASMRNTFMLAASARYTAMLDDSFGLYGEAGGMWSPSGRYTFKRSYANGAGTATGIGETWGQQGYVFGKIGAIFKVSATDMVTPYLELGYQTLQTGAYSETLSATNPFEARVAAATNGMGVLKLKGQWTHAINDDLDFAVTAGWGHGFNRTDSASANVTGFGNLTPNYRKATDWAEYGVRASYRFDEKWTGSVFANGVIGGPDVGSNHHFGVSALMRF